MGGIVGRIKIDGDQPGAMAQPLRMTFDHALGQRRAHTIKLTRTNGIFKARQRRLRSHIEARKRIAVQQHLVHGIGSQASRVVGIRITTANGENTLGEKIPQRMVNLARLPRIAQTARHAGDQSVALLGCLQQHCPTIGTALPLVEFQNQGLGKNLWKQQTLCRGRIGQAKASQCALNTVSSTCL